ncbi:MAG: WYL domain-containing protein [Actinomyces graevenitzii]|nr:WYL domain-containing protein [Actinomyces graevenitzii]
MSQPVSVEERVLNLLLALSGNPRGLTLRQITRQVAGYDAATQSSVERKQVRRFERDRATLRELGVVINSEVDVDNPTNTHPHKRYLLACAGQCPQLPVLTPVQLLTLELATHLFNSGFIGTRLSIVRAKLNAHYPLYNRVFKALPTPGPSLSQEVTRGLTTGAQLEFAYQGLHDRSPRQRLVWDAKLSVLEGGWYLDGFDQLAQAQRRFRVDRIVGQIHARPLSEAERPEPAPPSDSRHCKAVLWLAPDSAWQLKAHSQALGQNRYLLDYHPSDQLQLVSTLSSLAEQALVLEPADLAQAVLNRLQALETIDPKLPSRDEGGVSPAKTQSTKVYPPTCIVVARMLALVQWVKTHPGQSFDSLASHFGVSPQQIRKDVDSLSLVGADHVPWQGLDFDFADLHDGKVTLNHAGGLANQLHLDELDREVLALALAALEAGPWQSYARQLSQLLQLNPNIQAGMPGAGAQMQISQLAPVAAKVATAEDAVELETTASAEPKNAAGSLNAPLGQVFATVLEALMAGRSLKLSYVDAAGVSSQRNVDPWWLVSDGARLTLVGYCHGARAKRRFRLERISALSLGDQVRKAAPPANTSADKRRRSRSQSWGRTAQTATLRIRPSGIWLTQVAKAKQVIYNQDGTITVEIIGRSQAWLESVVLRASSELIAVEPATLLEKVSVRAAKARANYAQSVSVKT